MYITHKTNDHLKKHKQLTKSDCQNHHNSESMARINKKHTASVTKEVI